MPPYTCLEESQAEKQEAVVLGGQTARIWVFFFLLGCIFHVFSQSTCCRSSKKSAGEQQPGGGRGSGSAAPCFSEDLKTPGALVGPPPKATPTNSHAPIGPAPRTASSSGCCQTPPAHHKPFAWSPWSFFFWDRPVLRVLDQEKKAPFRFFSLSSSPNSSFRDLPDFDFPLNCHPMENIVKIMDSHFKMT